MAVVAGSGPDAVSEAHHRALGSRDLSVEFSARDRLVLLSSGDGANFRG
ncbi:hypothetical protein [Allokutzneria oryzae]|uniref:Uncharacterized protein n=1 Tax=Allokutzneria oryzae TaxID=1378989 RepID=A0ABV5ZQE1_9PSEU